MITKKYWGELNNYDVTNDVNAFYQYFNDEEIKNVNLTLEKISELKKTAKIVNGRKINFNPKIHTKSRYYVSTMNHIKSNYKRYGLDSVDEMYFLFMLSIDPELCAIKILDKKLDKSQTRIRFAQRFGIVDLNLVRLESIYINKLNKLVEDNKSLTKEKI